MLLSTDYMFGQEDEINESLYSFPFFLSLCFSFCFVSASVPGTRRLDTGTLGLWDVVKRDGPNPNLKFKLKYKLNKYTRETRGKMRTSAGQQLAGF